MIPNRKLRDLSLCKWRHFGTRGCTYLFDPVCIILTVHWFQKLTHAQIVCLDYKMYVIQSFCPRKKQVKEIKCHMLDECMLTSDHNCIFTLYLHMLQYRDCSFLEINWWCINVCCKPLDSQETDLANSSVCSEYLYCVCVWVLCICCVIDILIC